MSSPTHTVSPGVQTPSMEAPLAQYSPSAQRDASRHSTHEPDSKSQSWPSGVQSLSEAQPRTQLLSAQLSSSSQSASVAHSRQSPWSEPGPGPPPSPTHTRSVVGQSSESSQTVRGSQVFRSHTSPSSQSEVSAQSTQTRRKPAHT